MASLGKRFDATAHDTEQTDFELLPTGIYKLEVSAGDVKKDETTDNTSLNLAIDVIEPAEYAKRKFFVWIDLEHSDAEYQERGQRELAKLCRAIQVSDVEDTDDLLFKEFTAKVKKGEAGVGKKSGKPYKARNSIQKYFYPDEGAVPQPLIEDAPAANDNRPAARPAANQNAPAAVRPAGAKPWATKKAG